MISNSLNDWKISYAIYKDKTFFKGKEIARILGYKNPADAICKNVDERDKIPYMRISDTPQIDPKTIFISEAGLYKLIFSSNLPEAKKFTRWITDEVIPTIRKTGSYSYTPKHYIRNNHQLFIKNETDLHSNVISYIKELNESKYNVVYSVGLGEMQDTEAKRLDAWKKGYESGTPDLIVLNKTRKYDGFCIELKSPQGTGKLSEKQQHMIEKYKNLKYKTLVSNDYNEIITKIYKYVKNIRLPCLFCLGRFKNKDTLRNHLKWFHRHITE